jgi:hypothetical protein
VAPKVRVGSGLSQVGLSFMTLGGDTNLPALSGAGPNLVDICTVRIDSVAITLSSIPAAYDGTDIPAAYDGTEIRDSRESTRAVNWAG